MSEITTTPRPDLTDSDWEIVRLLTAGLFHYQVAIKVGLKPDAYRTRRSVIYVRTGTRTAAELAEKAVREGWIS